MFRHVGLFYTGSEDYTRGCTDFVQEGLRARAPVMVAVPGERSDLIESALGGDAGRVHFADMAVAGRNPGRILPRVLLDFAERHRGKPVWIIGEQVWPGRSDLEYPACVTHEALLNVAFAEREAAILCPYDTAGLGPQAVLDAQHTHPLLSDAAEIWPSVHFGDPFQLVDRFNVALPAPPDAAARTVACGALELRELRGVLTCFAEGAGMPPERVERLLVVVNELASNSVEHGGGTALMTVWRDGGTLVCQIDDQGAWPGPMAGRIPVAPGSLRGHGLVLVNDLADLVRVHHREDGTSVRVHLALQAS